MQNAVYRSAAFFCIFKLRKTPRKDEDKVNLALKMYDSKQYSITEITKATGVSKTTLYRYIKDAVTSNNVTSIIFFIDDIKNILDYRSRIMQQTWSMKPKISKFFSRYNT